MPSLLFHYYNNFFLDVVQLPGTNVIFGPRQSERGKCLVTKSHIQAVKSENVMERTSANVSDMGFTCIDFIKKIEQRVPVTTSE